MTMFILIDIYHVTKTDFSRLQDSCQYPPGWLQESCQDFRSQQRCTIRANPCNFRANVIYFYYQKVRILNTASCRDSQRSYITKCKYRTPHITTVLFWIPRTFLSITRFCTGFRHNNQIKLDHLESNI